MKKTLTFGALLIALTLLVPGCVGPGYYEGGYYDEAYCGPGPGPGYGPPVVTGPPVVFMQPYPHYYGRHGHWRH